MDDIYNHKLYNEATISFKLQQLYVVTLTASVSKNVIIHLWSIMCRKLGEEMRNQRECRSTSSEIGGKPRDCHMWEFKAESVTT